MRRFVRFHTKLQRTLTKLKTRLIHADDPPPPPGGEAR
jgi:hypothetical protein